MSNFQLYNILYLNLTFELLICLNILLLIKICYSITFPANFIEYHHLLLTFPLWYCVENEVYVFGRLLVLIKWLAYFT